MLTETFTQDALTLQLREGPESVQVLWMGRSTAREPGKFILRVLGKAMDVSASQNKPLVLDFQGISYMNSSTITPLIRLLERAKRGSSAVRVLYNKDLKWQELNFSALQIFRTDDSRIDICGV